MSRREGKGILIYTGVLEHRLNKKVLGSSVGASVWGSIH